MRSQNLNETITIREKRSRPWFWLENRLLDEYGSQIGPHGLAIYIALARYANNDSQTAHPKVSTLADLTGMSERKVREVLQDLAALGLIAITGRVGKAGAQIANEYTLCDLPPAPEKETTEAAPEAEIPAPVQPTAPPRERQPVPIDERRNHPAIQLFRSVTSRFPSKVLWPTIMENLTDVPHETATECYRVWVARGYNPLAIAWTEWPKKGTPDASNVRPLLLRKEYPPQSQAFKIS